MSSYRLLLNTLSVLDDTQGRVPELTGIENKIGGVISDLFRKFFGIDLITILSLIPVDNDFVIGFEFGEIIERVEVAKGVGPGEIAPAMGSKDSGKLVLFRSTEVRYVPDTLFKEILPVFTLINFTLNPDRVDNKAVF